MLYYKEESFELHCGKMQDVLPTFKEESIDSIVCDPPYGLTSITKRFGSENAKPNQYGKDGSFARLTKGFMGKEWDGSGVEYSVETWQHCYRVLKPGGYLLAFGGTRTFHRIACAIEDAGFEIRDTIMWLYGCLSSDTQILTSNGWKNSDTIQINDEIYSLDLEKNILIKNKVKNIFKYDYDGEMVNLKNANTNQLLTPNHHCIVNDKIRTRLKGETNYTSHDSWLYKDAWQIRCERTILPLASSYNGSMEIGNLFAELLGWVISEGTYHKDTNAIVITQSSVNESNVSRIRYILGKLHIKYNEYSRVRKYKDRTYIEYDFYIGKESEDVVNKIKELAPNKKLTYKLLELSLSNKEFLLKGLCGGDGGKSKNTKFGYSAFYQKDAEQLEIFQTLLHLTNKQGWINYKKSCCSIHSNPNTEIQAKHNKDRFVQYNGKYVWCIETEIGNFIAKREGKIFITGNSGFPKSLNVGIAIDKKLGNESKVVGTMDAPDLADVGAKQKALGNGHKQSFGQIENAERLQYEIKQAQNEWAGWGTSLKPAYEPIIVARKPFKGSLVDNVLKHGTGAINIDECRIGEPFEYQVKENGFGANFMDDNWQPSGNEYSKEVGGRFPANVILTYDETDKDEVCGGMPYTVSSGGDGEASTTKTFSNVKCGSQINTGAHLGGLGDEGSAARYFYCAKASKKDRDSGLIEFDQLTVNDGRKTEIDNPFQRGETLRKNTHPTVKPVELMQYLVRLVTRRGGGSARLFYGFRFNWKSRNV